MKKTLSIFLFTCVACFASYGQTNDFFTVTGKVILENGVDRDIVISAIYKGTNDIVLKKYLKANEPFALKFEFNKQFLVEFSCVDFYKKSINIDTHIDDVVMRHIDDIPPFPMIVSLFQRVDGVDDKFTESPVGKVYFDEYISGFIADVYTRDFDIKHFIKAEKLKIEKASDNPNKVPSANAANKASRIEVRTSWLARRDEMSYQDYINTADSLYDARMYNLARFFYVHAVKKCKHPAYCNKQIVRCQKKVEGNLKTIKKQELLVLKSMGDSLFNSEKYCKARFVFQKALLKAPLDKSLVKKIEECNKQIIK